MKVKGIILKTCLALTITFTASTIYAQPTGGLGGGNPNGPSPPVGAPIDGGAGLLLAGVAGYAYRKLRAKD
jgi:hypothetical protein